MFSLPPASNHALQIHICPFATAVGCSSHVRNHCFSVLAYENRTINIVYKNVFRRLKINNNLNKNAKTYKFHADEVTNNANI